MDLRCRVVWWLRFRLLVGFGTLWLRAFHWWVLLVDLWICVVGYCGRSLFGVVFLLVGLAVWWLGWLIWCSGVVCGFCGLGL